MFNSLYIYIHTFGHITRTPGEILHARRVALTATIFTRESCELIPSWWYWMPQKDVSFKVFEPSFEVFEVTSSGRCWEGSLLRLPMKLWRPLPRTMDGMMNSWLSAGPTFPFRWVVFVQSLETMKCRTCSGTKSARLAEPPPAPSRPVVVPPPHGHVTPLRSPPARAATGPVSPLPATVSKSPASSCSCCGPAACWCPRPCWESSAGSGAGRTWNAWKSSCSWSCTWDWPWPAVVHHLNIFQLFPVYFRDL